MIDLDAFEDWLYENFKPKTITNTMRSLRYLQKNGVQIGDRDSFTDTPDNIPQDEHGQNGD